MMHRQGPLQGISDIISDILTALAPWRVLERARVKAFSQGLPRTALCARGWPPLAVTAKAGISESCELWLEVVGFCVSFLLHTVLIFSMALCVATQPNIGTPFVIHMQSVTADVHAACDEWEIQDEPREQPHGQEVDPEATGESMASFPRIEEPPTLEHGLELENFTVDLESPAIGNAGVLNMPDAGALLAEVFPGKNGEASHAHRGKAAVEFYGVKATGQRFVFVTDCSGSMEGPPLQQVKEQLRKSISDLPTHAEFCVVFFNHAAIAMPSSDCVQATPDNIHRFLDWADQVQSSGGTDPSGALQLALALKPSVVFLLTDGHFELAPTLRVIGSTNTLPPVQIHTIAIGDRTAEPLLRRIAEDTNGNYRYVPK